MIAAAEDVLCVRIVPSVCYCILVVVSMYGSQERSIRVQAATVCLLSRGARRREKELKEVTNTGGQVLT
jgi:hypothetical protein